MRGKTYPSIKAAARAAGRSEKQAHVHLRRYGHLDFLGTDLTWTREDRRRAVTLGPYCFPSVSAAAAALGVDRKTIRNARTRSAARQTVLKALMMYKENKHAL